MSQNILLIFFGVIAALFVIVLLIMFIGYTRSSQRRRAANSPDAMKVEAERRPVAEQLQQYPSRDMGDRRGEDVGGNFSRVARSEDTRRSAGSDSGR